MKNSLACPKCESRKLWRIERIRNESDSHGGSELPVALLKVDISWTGPTQKTIGRYDAYLCAACGNTEFWAHNFDELSHQPEKAVHFIDATPQQSEYR